MDGQEAVLQSPQVFPFLSWMNPFSPQEDPQEFLTFQVPLVSTPTNNTP